MCTASLFVKATNEINPMSINNEMDKITGSHLHVIEIRFSHDKKLLLHPIEVDIMLCHESQTRKSVFSKIPNSKNRQKESMVKVVRMVVTFVNR